MLSIALSCGALRRCAPTALIVGSLLSIINQGGVIARGDTSYLTWMRVALNYLIPFVVANVGYYGAVLARRSGEDR